MSGRKRDSQQQQEEEATTKPQHDYPDLDPQNRYGEHGVIDAQQADESHFDERFREDDEVSENEEEETAQLAQAGRIRFSEKKLYGRDKELHRLKELFKAVVQQPPVSEDSTNNSSGELDGVTKTVFVSGFSGCGKSSLIKMFVEDVQSSRRISGAKCHQQVLFLTAKYERTQSSAPFSAFSTLFDDIPLSLRDEFRHVYTSLQDSLSDEVHILWRIFPQLRYLFSGRRNSIAITNGSGEAIDTSVESLQNPASGGGLVSTTSSKILELRQSCAVNKSRLKFAISCLFRALSAHLNNRPLILFIDDLQWADQPGLELLQTLIADESMQYLLFVGSYRSNEIDVNPHFQKMMENLDGKVPKEMMHIGAISCQATGEFIADSLGLSTKDVEPLTQVVFNKTLGNPLYTRQALEHLVRKNVLYYDNMVFSWTWNLGSTQDISKSGTTKYLEDLLAEDILSMVKSKIQNLPDEGLQRTLAAASFVRASFDSDTLLQVMLAVNGSDSSQENIEGVPDITLHAEKKSRLTDSLRQGVEEGLLLCTSDPHDDNRTYAFAHDQIQEAATTFLPEDRKERDAFLVKVGLGLLRRAEAIEEDEDWMFFAAARNLNSVTPTHALLDDEIKRRMVELNAHAAQMSLNLLAFENAIEYVAKGLLLLTEISQDMWKTDYKLTMDLYNMGAQAEHGACHMDKAEAYCTEAMKRKKDTLSALPAYKVHLDILAWTEDLSVALQMNLRVLEEIGKVKFPKSESGRKIKAWMTLQQMKAFGLPTEQKISNMSRASDPRAVATMEFIQKAVRFAFGVKPYTYTLLCCEAIKWMDKYGLTDTSGASTASFANVVTHTFGDFQTGARLAKLAIFIIDRQKNKFYETQALNTANNNVLGWVVPIKTRLPYHVRAYESGLTSGNLEGACVGKWFQFFVLYHSSSPLSILEQELQTMKKRAEKWGYMFFKNLYAILLQLVLNLVGKSENTTKLAGGAADETDSMWQKMPHKAAMEAFRSQAMVFFGDFESGAEDALTRGNFYTQKIIGMQYGLEPFYRGICLYAMARKTGEKKYKKGAKEVRKQYQVWVKKGCVNLAGLLKLLDAEEFALVKKQSYACKKYEDAIRTLISAGFYSNAGVACERYAKHLIETGQLKEARSQLEQAKAHYNRWGAQRKVEMLTNQLADMQ